MNAMILAAGRGKRMMPLTEHTPKPLLPVMGKPLLQYHIENLKKANITNIVINHCYLGSQIETYFGNGNQYGVNITWSTESHPLETAGGIKKALPLLGQAPFLVVNGDIWCDFPYNKLLNNDYCKTLEKKNLLAHLILVANPEHNSEGDFGLSFYSHDDKNNDHALNHRIINHSKQMWTFSGIGVYSPHLFDSCQLEQPQGLAAILRKTAALQLVSGEIYSDYWQDVGTPQRLNLLIKQLKTQQLNQL